jgi:AbrB family looped-hinge helix DNA binding protein
MINSTSYKTRLRRKGQITVPGEIRSLLNAKEGDDLVFYIDEQNHIIIERARIIPPDQAWFWTEHWQQMEREAQAEIDAGDVLSFDNVQDALKYLHDSAKTNA